MLSNIFDSMFPFPLVQFWCNSHLLVNKSSILRTLFSIDDIKWLYTPYWKFGCTRSEYSNATNFSTQFVPRYVEIDDLQCNFGTNQIKHFYFTLALIPHTYLIYNYGWRYFIFLELIVNTEARPVKR